MTAEQVVAELSDGMTVGIGGWGSRRKPMHLVEAIARSDLEGFVDNPAYPHVTFVYQLSR